MHRRSGFTLIEILVVVGVVGVLAGLLLAAFQAARESSRRFQCAANLRQIGLAMHHYEARAGILPSALMQGDRYAPPGQTHRGFPMSAFVRILPELDQQPLMNTINFDVSGIASENTTAASSVLGVFLCPSDGAPRRAGMGPMNYRVNMGSGINVRDSPEELGPFESLRWITLAKITDGLATTALVAEKSRGDGDPSRWDQRRDFWYADCPSFSTEEVVAWCGDVPIGNPPHNSWAGATWFYSDFSSTQYNHAVEPNARTPDCSRSSEAHGAAGSGVFAARSWHGGGVHVTMADGSVRWVGSGISRSIWRALGTRAGGEVVSSDAY